MSSPRRGVPRDGVQGSWEHLGTDGHPKASLSLGWRQEPRTAVGGPRGLCLRKHASTRPARGLTPVSTQQDIPVFLPKNDSDKSDPPAPPRWPRVELMGLSLSRFMAVAAGE